MKRIYLVDSENVGDVWVPLLVASQPEEEVIVFYTQKSPHMNYENVRLLKETEKEAEFIKCFEGSNALDFQLVTQLGYMLCENQENRYVIVSNDTGFDAAVRYWKQRNMPVERLSGKELSRRLQQKAKMNSEKEAVIELGKENARAVTEVFENKTGTAVGAADVTAKRELTAETEDTAKRKLTAEADGTEHPQLTVETDVPENPEQAAEASGTEHPQLTVETDVPVNPEQAAEASGTEHPETTTEADVPANPKQTAKEAGIAKRELTAEANGTKNPEQAAEEADTAKRESMAEADVSENPEQAAETNVPENPEQAAETVSNTKLEQTTEPADTAKKKRTARSKKSAQAKKHAKLREQSETEEGQMEIPDEIIKPGGTTDQNWMNEPIEQENANPDWKTPMPQAEPDREKTVQKTEISKEQDEIIRSLLTCISKDHLADFHNALVLFFGEETGKELYQEAKNSSAYAICRVNQTAISEEEKFDVYCHTVFAYSDPRLDCPEDFSSFLYKSNAKRKNLNSLRAALQGHYGKDKGMKYYSLFKSHIKIMNRM